MNEMFYASLITSLIALGGVLLTLRINQRNFEITRREEREKAREEREFAAKHKAILDAADSVMRFLNYYMTLPDRELPKDGTIPNEVSDAGINLNTLHFYCDLDSIKSAVAMGQMLSTAYASAIKAKLPAMFIAEDIKVLDIHVTSLERANDHLQGEIMALLSSDASNPLIVSHRQQLASNFRQLSELHKKKSDLYKTKFVAIEACRDVITKDIAAVYGSLRDVLLMARKELKFPIDEKGYATLIDKSNDDALTAIKQLYDEIRAQARLKIG
jgi:hypothetical protein